MDERCIHTSKNVWKSKFQETFFDCLRFSAVRRELDNQSSTKLSKLLAIALFRGIYLSYHVNNVHQTTPCHSIKFS